MKRVRTFGMGVFETRVTLSRPPLYFVTYGGDNTIHTRPSKNVGGWYPCTMCNYDMCTMCGGYVYNVWVICVRCVIEMCTICRRYMYDMWVMCVQCVVDMCTICDQYVYDVCFSKIWLKKCIAKFRIFFRQIFLNGKFYFEKYTGDMCEMCDSVVYYMYTMCGGHVHNM